MSTQATQNTAVDETRALIASLPVLDAAGGSLVNTPKGGQLRSTITLAAQQLNDVVWGGAGDISGMTQRIPIHKLWVMWEQDKDPLRVAEMVGSLQTQGQKQPLIVTPARDPRPFDQGGTGGEYLVLDGKIRYWAAPIAGLPTLEELDCVPQLYNNAWDALYSAFVMKASQRELTDEQASRWFRRMKAIHTEASKRMRELPKWPTQEQWARILGRNQSTISRWQGIADMHPTVQQLVEDRRLSETAAADMQPLPRREQGVLASQLEDERTSQNRDTIPRSRVRQVVESRRSRPVTWSQEPPPVPVGEMLMPGLANYDAPTAFGILAHDTIKVLGALMGSAEHPHPAVAKLHQALMSPEIAAWIMQVRAQLNTVEGGDVSGYIAEAS